jgi:hypothetical protein
MPSISTALAAIASSLDVQAAGMAHARAHAPAALRPAITRAIVRAHRAAMDARSWHVVGGRGIRPGPPTAVAGDGQ